MCVSASCPSQMIRTIIYLDLLFQNENHFFANSMQWRKKWEKNLIEAHSCYLWYVVNVAHGGLFAFLGPQWNQKLICFFAQSLFGLWTLAGVGWWCRDHPQYGKIIQKEVLGVQLFMKNQKLGERRGAGTFFDFFDGSGVTDDVRDSCIGILTNPHN